MNLIGGHVNSLAKKYQEYVKPTKIKGKFKMPPDIDIPSSDEDWNIGREYTFL